MTYSFSGLAAATFGNVTDGAGELVQSRISEDGEIYITISADGVENMLIGTDSSKMLFPIFPSDPLFIETGNPIGLLLALTYA